MPTEKTTRRKYTEDFKRDAVALVTEQGYKVSEAARVPQSTSGTDHVCTVDQKQRISV